MLRWLGATALVAALPTTALGLSCAPFNFADEFNRVAEADELYTVAYGELRATGEIPDYANGKPRRVDYHFEGYLNFGRTKQSRDIVVQTECAASWCGELPEQNTAVFMFLEHRSEGLSLRAGPCTADYLVRPSLGQVSALRNCMRNRTCGQAERAAFGN